MLKLIDFRVVWIKIEFCKYSIIVRFAALFVINSTPPVAPAAYPSIRRMKFECSQNQHLLCTYLNPDLRRCDAIHTTLSLVHNVSEKETKRNRRLYFFYRSKNVVTYQHRASEISFICTLVLLSVPSWFLLNKSSNFINHSCVLWRIVWTLQNRANYCYVRCAVTFRFFIIRAAPRAARFSCTFLLYES